MLELVRLSPCKWGVRRVGEVRCEGKFDSEEEAVMCLFADLFGGFVEHPEVGDCRYAPDGGEYTELTANGVFEGKAEGFPTQAETTEAFRDTLRAFLGDPPGTVYWRVKPELMHREAYDGACFVCNGRGCSECDGGHVSKPELWNIYARLRVSRGDDMAKKGKGKKGGKGGKPNGGMEKPMMGGGGCK